MDVPRETQERLERYRALVIGESEHQNLIAASTIPTFWDRHIVDALQLIPQLNNGRILDIGSGAGIPGLVLACYVTAPFTLVEPRRRRADFLRTCVETLKLNHVTVVQQPVERVIGEPYATIMARAVMSTDRLFKAANHLASEATRWLLLKGRSYRTELAVAQLSWQGRFEVVPSLTDADAAIVVAEGVRRREG